MNFELEAKCSHCEEPALHLYVCEAHHDAGLIDVVVECTSCGRQLNAFVSLAEMSVLTPGSGEVL
ncbi:hypothetical protein D9M68_728590 [compost metagenome]